MCGLIQKKPRDKRLTITFRRKGLEKNIGTVLE